MSCDYNALLAANPCFLELSAKAQQAVIAALLCNISSAGGGGGSGTVTSFSAGNLDPLFTTSVATAGTTPALTFAQESQLANLVFASPNGAPGNPTFRALVAADLPGAVVPSGVIALWHGTIATIPSGWFLCNGANGTPDLRNLFIVGANADSGGAAKSTITGSALQSGGANTHTHTTPAGTSGASVGLLAPTTGDPTTNVPSQDDISAASASWSQTNTHTHSTPAGVSGSATAIPTFFALAYIMKS